MSWDNRQGPWGKENRPPEIDEILEKFQERLRNLFGGRRVPGIWLILIVGAILWLATGIYQVNQDQVGVVQRFGAYSRTVGPGLHWKMPSGIERVTKVSTTRIFQEEFGFRTLRAGVRTEYAPERQFERESLMLTGDLNCAIVPWTVRYRIGDPYNFLFKVRNVEETLRDLSEATMRALVGDYSLDEVLNQREILSSLAQEHLQGALDAAESGIVVTTIELGKTNVPEPVQPSFNEVNAAIQEKEKRIYQAQGAYNKVIPEARGTAERRIQEAEGFAVDRVERAKGDVARFLSLYEEYAKAKEITRSRLYLESIEATLPRLGKKYVVDTEEGGVLPLLNLGEKGVKP